MLEEWNEGFIAGANHFNVELIKNELLNIDSEKQFLINTEQTTGEKWIDGKDIFRQTFAMATPGVGDITLPHGINTLDLIISSIEGYCVLADDTKITLPVINHASSGGGGGGSGSSADAGNTITLVEWDGTNLLGYIGTNYTLTKAVASLVFSIKYTKE